MSARDQFLPLWVGDYLRDTMDLDCTTHGIYLLLLMHEWSRGPLPNDPKILRSIARVSHPKFSPLVGQILHRFFILRKDGFWVQKRLEAEREKRGEISDVRRSAARKRHAKADANALQTPCKRHADSRARPSLQLELKNPPHSPPTGGPGPPQRFRRRRSVNGDDLAEAIERAQARKAARDAETH